MDLDFLLERNGKFLVQEFKPEGVRPGIGQGRTLRALRSFADVWVVYGDGPVVQVDFGDGDLHAMTTEEYEDETVLWFEEASK